MHDTAYELGSLFFDAYCAGSGTELILDVGAMDVNGTLRDCSPPGCVYVGVDLALGPGVDLVLEDPYSFPFSDGYFDAVISTSCLEHDQMFWLTFLEMLRVTRRGGYLYMNCPSNGEYHAYPSDNWRFYPDSGLAFVQWAHRNSQPVTLVESFVARRKNDQWNDCVMVFFRGDKEEISETRLISDTYRACFNIRTFRSEDLENFSKQTEDALLLKARLDQVQELEGCSGFKSTGPEPHVVEDLAARFDANERRLATVDRQLRIFRAALENIERRATGIVG